MFSNALKSFTSNISSNYTLSPQPISQAGPWKIFDAKKKSTGQAVSAFVFERKSLDPSNSSSGGGALSFRSSSSSHGLKALHDEVVERLKKEASSLARLRHPSILELVEPVEETRSGGLQFVTEQVSGSLGATLREKDELEGKSGRSGRYVVEDGQGGRKRREVEIDEIEIQKGLLQIAKGLEFLHESAGLVHCNLTPEAIFINSKNDWKLSSLSFATPYTSTEPSTSSVSALIAQDPRIPSFVQLSLDYVSPDLLLDNTLSPSVDLFSLGLLIVALYNSPHVSPLQTHNSASTYKRLLSSPSTTPNAGNEFLSSRPLPKTLKESLLPRLLTRRPASRLTARELEENPYFDNILVSTLRFLESLPAKTPKEKSAFMRGLPKVIPQFPKSVLEKKVLPLLVEELKDKELIPLILPNIFAIIDNCPGGQRLLSEKVLGRLKSIYSPNGTSTPDPARSSTPTQGGPKKQQRSLDSTALEAGLVVILDHLQVIIAKTTSREFKEDVLPLVHLALDSSTHSLQDRALRTLETILPALDFPTVKNELFPVVAAVFARTNSLGIKIRGLEAFKVLCGGGHEGAVDGLDGIAKPKPAGAATALDKYTIQDKMVPLLKAIKTKEPGVMIAALEVFNVIGQICDKEVLASDIIPILWSMALGPLLGLEQFKAFMATIKAISLRIEQEHTRKLEELQTSSSGAINTSSAADFLSFGGLPGASVATPSGDTEFEALVFGKKTTNGNDVDGDWGWGEAAIASPQVNIKPQAKPSAKAPAFSWSTPSPTSTTAANAGSVSMGDLTPFKPLTPSNSDLASSLHNSLSFGGNSTSNNTSNGAMATSVMAAGMGMGTIQPLQPSRSGLGTVGFGSTTAMRPTSSTSTFTYSPPSARNTSSTRTSIDWSSAMKKSGFSSSATTSTITLPNQNNTSDFSWNIEPHRSPFPPSQQPPVASSSSSNALQPTILAGQTRMQNPSGSSKGPDLAAFKLAPPPGFGQSSASSNIAGGISGNIGRQQQQQAQQQKKTGLDAWESLL